MRPESNHPAPPEEGDDEAHSTEDEIDTLNCLVVIFLETAELRAKRQTITSMTYWRENVGQIIAANGYPLPADPEEWFGLYEVGEGNRLAPKGDLPAVVRSLFGQP